MEGIINFIELKDTLQEATNIDGGMIIIVLILAFVCILLTRITLLNAINEKKPSEERDTKFINKINDFALLFDSTAIMFIGFTVQAVWTMFLFILTFMTLAIDGTNWVKIVVVLGVIYSQLMLYAIINQIYSIVHAKEVIEYNVQRTKPSCDGSFYTLVCNTYLSLYAITYAIFILANIGWLISKEIAVVVFQIFGTLSIITVIMLLVIAVILRIVSNTHKEMLKKKILKIEGLFH